MELTLGETLEKAIEAHKAGQIQEADKLYTAILKIQPKHTDANHNKGLLAFAMGQTNEALSFFKTALDADPNTGQFWISYMEALMKLGRSAEAQSLFDQAKDKGKSFL
jgi:protein O-GlcNAc transferase